MKTHSGNFFHQVLFINNLLPFKQSLIKGRDNLMMRNQSLNFIKIEAYGQENYSQIGENFQIGLCNSLIPKFMVLLVIQRINIALIKNLV